MNTFDIVILSVVAMLAVVGYRQGFIIGVSSLIGMALGGVVGTRVARAVLEEVAADQRASELAPLMGLAVGLLIMLVGTIAMQDLGGELRGRLRTGEHAAVDHLLGSLLLAAVGLLLAWFAAASAISAPQLRELRPQLLESQVVRTLNRALPPPGPILGVLARYDPFPQFDGGRIVTAPPDARLPKDPEVRRASRSVLRILGSACGYQVTGSGWVVAPGYVVTNAHVVAGQDDTGVQPGGNGQVHDADVVAFDSVNDLAIVRVEDLDLPALPMVDPRPDVAAVVLGYPENRGFTAVPARFSDTRDVGAEDIYGERPGVRSVTSFRGVVRHGNSGGPLVDGNGRVLTTVFASTVGERLRGGYGVPNERVREALGRARGVPADRRVRTGPCIA